MDIREFDAMRRSRGATPSRRKGIAGQAMVLFLVLVGVLCLGVVLLFDTGQTVNKKVRLTNTADAAAYSVAVQQARAMNFAAYMNRGRVANEVAIAQLVSLWSWMNMMHTHTVVGHNFFTYLSWVPYVNVVAKPLAQAYKAAEKVVSGIRAVYRPVASMLISGGGIEPVSVSLDDLNGLLATAADAMLAVGAGADGYLIAKDVIEANDPDARLAPVGEALLIGQLAHAGIGGGLLDRHKAATRNPGMDRFRNVVMGSRDHFSADRGDQVGLPFIKIVERGGTDMVEYDRWAAMDTIDLRVKVDLGFWELKWNLPLGFGGAQAVRSGQPDFFPGIQSGGENRNEEGWYTEYHPPATYDPYGSVGGRSGNLAARYPSVNAPASRPFFTPMRPSGSLNQKKDAYFTGYTGLRDYYDVKEQYGKSPEGEDAGPIFTVFVESDRAKVRTSQDIDGIGGPSGGQLELNNGMSGDKMTAISSAQVYFNRPPADPLGAFRRMVPKGWGEDASADNQLEMGSLFSPYWQARLTETPTWAYAAVGITSLASGSP